MFCDGGITLAPIAPHDQLIQCWTDHTLKRSSTFSLALPSCLALEIRSDFEMALPLTFEGLQVVEGYVPVVVVAAIVHGVAPSQVEPPNRWSCGWREHNLTSMVRHA